MRPSYNPAFGRGYNSTKEVDDLNGKWLAAIMFSTLAASAAYDVDAEWVCIADQLNVRDDGASSAAVVDSCVNGFVSRAVIPFPSAALRRCSGRAAGRSPALRGPRPRVSHSP